MEDMVRSISRTRLLGSLRRPSLAGDGLPERMRTTAFVFLGLTAAAGLALVAIFAQVGLPVLSPSPAPSGPLRAGSVSRAVALDRDRGVPAPGLAGGGIVPSGVRGDARAGGKGAPGDHRVGAVGSPLAVATPPANGGGVDGGSTEAPTSAPTPSAPPAPSGDATTTTVPTPAPDPEEAVAPEPKEKPAKTTAKTKPAKPKSKPSKSESKAPKAEAKAPSGDSKVESMTGKAEAKQESKPPEAESDPGPPSKSSPPPAPEAPAEKSNGKALGHDK